MALGSLISGAVRLREDYFVAAAEVLSSMTTDEDIRNGGLLPRFRNVQHISANIAARVAQMAYDDGEAASHRKSPNTCALLPARV